MTESGWDAGPVGKLRSLPRQNGHYIICGGNALARRLVDDLVNRYQVTVIAIVPAHPADHHVDEIRKLLPPNLVISQDRITDETLDAAWISTAQGIALVDGTDQSMIQAALRAENRNKDVRIVVRMFNQRLAAQIESQLGNCAALSGSYTAAPAFANEALNRPYSVDVGDRTICVIHNPPADGPAPLCVLADRVEQNDPTRMRVLPERSDPTRPGRAVLQFQQREPAATISRRSRLRWWLADLRRLLGELQLRLVLATVLSTVVTAFVLIWALGGRLWWAVYTTLLDLAGSAQPDVPTNSHGGTGGSWQRAAQVSLTFCGIAFIPIVTAILLTGLENRRGALPKRPGAGIRDHVIVLGLGNVGTRIATYLHDAGVPVVALDRNSEARGIAMMRDLRIPVVIGDDPMETRLQKAGLARSRAIVAATSDDAANLEAILEARSVKPRLRAVLRLFDDEFSYLVYGKFENLASRSVSFLSAPAFAAALMGHEVLGTLSVFRQIFIVAELPINQDSGLIRQTLRELESSAALRVIAVRGGGPGPSAGYDWAPDLSRKPQVGDRIVAVATTSGFSWLNDRNGSPDAGRA
ncbi:MAG TPA: NAD-binding protein [Actinocrinis sp.]|nr:NAD-binding protein [Actinocrinis sp.]